MHQDQFCPSTKIDEARPAPLIRRGAPWRMRGAPARCRSPWKLAADALHDVLRRGDRPRDDVRLCLQAYAHHADGVFDAASSHDELLRYDMQDLAVHGDFGSALAASITWSTSSLVISLSLPDRDDPAGVDALDVAAGNAGVHPVRLAPRHELRGLDGLELI